MGHMGMWAHVGTYSINGGDMGKTHRKNAGLVNNGDFMKFSGISWNFMVV